MAGNQLTKPLSLLRPQQALQPQAQPSLLTSSRHGYLSAQTSLLTGPVAEDRIRETSQTQAPESQSLSQQGGCSQGMGGYLPRHPGTQDPGISWFALYPSEPVGLCWGRR